MAIRTRRIKKMLHRLVKMIIIKITKVMTFFNNKFTLNAKQKPNAIFIKILTKKSIMIINFIKIMTNRN